MMPATISISHANQETTINIKGRFNFEMLTCFRVTYQNQMTNKGLNRRFIIDMAGTEYIDSSAMGMLLLLREEVGTNETNFEITSARSGIRKILETAGLHRFFKIT